MAEYRVPNILGFEWQKSVLDKDLATPPSSPNEGDRYLIASDATDDWSGHDGDITWYENGAWYFIPKKEGMFVYVKDEDKLYYYNGSSWQEFASGSGSNADTLDGYDTGQWNAIPVIRNDGVMEVGKFIDFHLSADSTADYEPRLTATGQDLELWNSNGHHKIWHSGNDGSGSGLDADLLRGLPADFTCSKSTNGYTKLPNGLILQWGKSTANVSGTGWVYNVSVTFPVQFPNEVFSVVMFRDNGNTADIDVYDRRMHNIATSSFHYDFFVRTVGVSGTVNWYWLAIGY